MAEQEKTYDEKVQEVKEAPGEGAGQQGDGDADQAETERAEK